MHCQSSRLSIDRAGVTGLWRLVLRHDKSDLDPGWSVADHVGGGPLKQVVVDGHRCGVEKCDRLVVRGCRRVLC